MDVMLRSLDPGKYVKFVHFDTFPYACSLHLTLHPTSTMGVLEGASIGYDPRKKFTLTQCLTQSMWFEGFMYGVELMVGRISHQIKLF